MTKKWCALILASLVSHSAISAEWQLQPYVFYTAEFSDNVRLSSGETANTIGHLLRGGGRFGVESPTSIFYVEPSLIFRRFNKQSDLLDTDDRFLDVYLQNRSERSSISLAGSFEQESTLTSELADADDGNPDLDDPVNDDSGNSQISTRRDRLYLRPEWMLDVSRRTAVAIGARYTDVDYQEIPGLSLSDFESASADFTFRFKSTEKLMVGSRLQASNYEGSSTGNETDGLSLELIMQYSISPRTVLSGSAGAFRSDASFLQNGSLTEIEETESILSIGLTRRDELNEFETSFRRTVSGSAIGGLSVRNQLLFGLNRHLSERTRFILKGRVFTSRANSDTISGSDRDYARVEIGYDWQLTTKLAVSLTYQYTAQERKIAGNTTDGNALSVSFGYRPQRLAVSR